MSAGPAHPILPSDENFAQHDAEDRWKQALETYRLETGHDLLKHSFAQDILSKTTVDDVMGRLKLFMAFRARGHKILGVLKPIVSVLLRFVDAGAEGASKVAPGGKAIFVAFGVLLQATKGVSQLYNAIESLLQKVRHYVERIEIHLNPSTPPTPAVMRILLDTLVQLLNVLATVTKYCDRAAERHSWLRQAKDTVSLRTKDYFRVMMDKTDVADTGGTHRGRLTKAGSLPLRRPLQRPVDCLVKALWTIVIRKTPPR